MRAVTGHRKRQGVGDHNVLVHLSDFTMSQTFAVIMYPLHTPTSAFCLQSSTSTNACSLHFSPNDL